MLTQFDRITQYLEEVGTLLSSLPLEPIQHIIDTILEAQQYGRTVYIIGNGGSASTATHFACDLQKWTLGPTTPRLRAVALTDNMALFSAWANDNGYEHVFEEQLRTLLGPGDVVVAISGSGRSSNVVRAVRWANMHGATTIALTGYEGGDLLPLTDHCVVVPSDRMNQIEDVHMALCHLIADQVRGAVPPAQPWLAPAATQREPIANPL